MKKQMVYLVIILLLSALFATGCERVSEEKEEAAAASARQLIIQKEGLAEQAEKKLEEMRAELPKAALIETEVVLQKPELPAGCESVALTMALQSLGYQLEKTAIAEQYLIYSKDNFAAGYVGDPFTYTGEGIFPPGLTETANKYLSQRYQQQTAYDMSRLELEELFPYVAAQDPVILWVTLDMEEPYFSENTVEYGGDEYRWYWNEHCVMLGGYDLEKETVTLYDPLKGKVEYPMETVKHIYNETGKYAVVIY